MYAIILAGGQGTRLWPLSRGNTPKQLLYLFSTRSLLQETVDRLAALMPLDNIVIVTGAPHAEETRRQLPELPEGNVLVEPAPRGTAPAIGLGLLHIQRLARSGGEPDPVIGSFHADHVITKVPEFHKTVQLASEVAEQGYIVTLGIATDRPHTGYGYIKQAASLSSSGDSPVYQVERFVEKPPLAVAEEYLATRLYSWNSGMFIWKLSMILGEFERHQPQLYQQLLEIDATGAATSEPAVERIWSQIRTETIDVGIAEKSDRLAVIPADFGWSDVGDWSSVAELLMAQAPAEENAVVGDHLGLDTTGSLVYSSREGKIVATIGLRDLVIVDTADALLVCDRSQTQSVKTVVEKLKERGWTQYL